jgi:hypothetical protein
MQDKTIASEFKCLEQINSIDIEKELFSIMENPEIFFNQYLKNIHTPSSIMLAQWNILSILITIDTSEKFCNKSADYFLSKYSVEKWLDKLSGFYEYTISLITYIIENHDNSILDLYNEKKITKTMMVKGISSFNKAKKQLVMDKDDALICLRDLEVEKEKLKDF